MRPNPAEETLAAPYYPTLFEFIILLVTVALVCSVGILIFRKWTQRGLTPPIWLAATTWVLALAIYVFVAGFLWSRVETPRKLTTLFYGLAFWIPPVVYYSHVLLNAFATRSVKRLSWLGIPAAEFESYREARRLASMGDIEGAVAVYQTYEDGRPYALVAAANLLELDGQFARSAEVLQTAMSEVGEETRNWAEAAFRLAKIYEYHLGQQNEALTLYKKIVGCARNSEHGRLAASKLATLQAAGYEAAPVSVKPSEEEQNEGEEEQESDS